MDGKIVFVHFENLWIWSNIQKLGNRMQLKYFKQDQALNAVSIFFKPWE